MSNMSGYANWRHQCIINMKAKLQSNVAARSKKVEEVVNECIVNINKELQIGSAKRHTFLLCDRLIISSLESMYTKLDEWSGVNISSCKTIPTTFDEYWYIADNWWNRQKGSWFGDYYFYKLFHSLFQFCTKYAANYNLYRDLLFYNVLHDIVKANVSFKRARPQPLLFDQSLEKSADLKQYFITLLSLNIDKKCKNKKLKLRKLIVENVTEIKDRKFNEFFQQKSCKFHNINVPNTATATAPPPMYCDNNRNYSVSNHNYSMANQARNYGNQRHGYYAQNPNRNRKVPPALNIRPSLSLSSNDSANSKVYSPITPQYGPQTQYNNNYSYNSINNGNNSGNNNGNNFVDYDNIKLSAECTVSVYTDVTETYINESMNEFNPNSILQLPTINDIDFDMEMAMYSLPTYANSNSNDKMF